MTLGNLYPYNGGRGAEPGMSVPGLTTENQPWFGPFVDQWLEDVIIDGASRDTGNAEDTTLLRSGLLMGTVTATGKLKPWSPYASDGTSRITHVLNDAFKTQVNGANADRYYGVLQWGNILSERIIIAGTAAPGIAGHANEALIKKQLQEAGFKLDVTNNTGPADAYLSAAKTLTAADSGTRYFVDGTFSVTLPAASEGVEFSFVQIGAGTITIAADPGTLTTGDDNVVLNAINDSATVRGVSTDSGTTNEYAVVDGTGYALS